VETNGIVSAILRTRRRRAAVILSVAFTAAALFCCGPYEANAGGPTTQEQTRIAIAENAEVLADIVIFNSNPNMVDMTKKTDELAKQEANDKHTNYAKDHVPVLTKVAPGRETNDYIDNATALNLGVTDPGTPTIFSTAYQDRVEEFRLGARNILQSNNAAARDIKNSQNKILQLKAASDGSESYIGLTQAGGQISTFLSQETSKLMIDIDRQIVAETQFTLNEQREREEELLAFEGALKSWAIAEGAGERY
jgi:hypothetical protein